MIEIKAPEDLARLRDLALSAQGLISKQPFGNGLKAARKAIKHLGYVQIDTISVIERAHNHVFYSRVADFKPEMTNQLLLNRDIFEHWTHAAALIPMEDFRFSLPYKLAIKSGQVHWYKNPDTKLMKELLEQIRSDGALRSRDLEAKSKKGAGWWDWKPAKKALEQLYMQGDLMVSGRDGFQKIYDLTERVVPTEINSTMPTADEFAEHMIDQQLRCHGLVSLKGITYKRRNTDLRKAVKKRVNDLVQEGSLARVQLTNGEQFLIKDGALDMPLPQVDNRLRILSPFDNSVIQRDRLKAIFQFDYQIECYVTEAKRQYGYFSLPILFQNEFIGRMDCKAHRKEKQLEIKSLYIEKEDLDEDLFLSAFSDTLQAFRQFHACDQIKIGKVQPYKLRSKINQACS